VEPVEGAVPEAPAVTSAQIVREPTSRRECLLVTTATGERLAFAFELGSDFPGLERVDPGPWLAAAADGAPADSEAAFDAVEDARADEWLQPLLAHPVGAEWLGHIREESPEEFRRWFSQADFDEGGEEGSG
jgi:hypothetical protein